MNLSRQKIVPVLLFLLTGLFASRAPVVWARDRLQEDSKGGKPPEESVNQKAQKIFGLRPGEAARFALDDCIKRALTYNLEIQAANYSIDEAREKKTEASRLGYPLLDYEYNLAPIPRDVSNAVTSFFSGDITVFNKFKLGIGFPLDTFGKVTAGQRLAEKGVAAEREKKILKEADVIVKIKQLYNGILLAREVKRLLQSAREGVNREINKRESEGGADPTELLKLKIFREDLEKRMEEGDKREILAHEALRVQLGLDSSTPFDLSADKLRPVPFRLGRFEDYRDEALAKRHDLKALEIGYQAKADQIRLEKRLMAPNLAVGTFFEIGRAPGVTGLARTDDFTDPFNFTRAGFGLQLKGTLDFHTSLSKVRQEESELYKIDVQRDLAEDGVELEVKEAYLDVRNTKLDVDRAEEAGKLSRQLLFLTQSNYDIGIAESKDLIDGLQGFLQTRGQYFEAVFNFNVAVAKLEQKIGRVAEY